VKKNVTLQSMIDQDQLGAVKNVE